jgi:hypothetical protein
MYEGGSRCKVQREGSRKVRQEALDDLISEGEHSMQVRRRQVQKSDSRREKGIEIEIMQRTGACH